MPLAPWWQGSGNCYREVCGIIDQRWVKFSALHLALSLLRLVLQRELESRVITTLTKIVKKSIKPGLAYL